MRPKEEYTTSPKHIHIKNQTQLIGGISIIKYKQQSAPIIGMTEYLRKKLRMDTIVKMNMKTKNRIS